MLQKTRGIVLHSLRYGETSIITHIYTRSSGRKSFIFKGIRNRKSKIHPNLIQPLALLELEFKHSTSDKLHYSRETNPYYTFNSIYYNNLKLAQTFFMAEVLGFCLKEEEPNTDLFDFLENSLIYFDHLESGFVDFHLYFLVRLTKYLGFFPSLSMDPSERYFDLKEGGFRASIPHHHSYLEPELSEIMNRFLSENYESLNMLGLKRDKRNSFLDALLSYYSFHFDDIRNITSHKILREIF